MKCDELKSLKNIECAFNTTTQQEQAIAEDSDGNCYGFDSWEEVYLKEDVDEAIAELKAKLESVQASMYCDVVDVNMENRRLRRALWIARAKRAIEKIAWFKLWNASISTMNPEDCARQEFDKWKKNLGKCLKKAEEYKK